MRRLPGQNKKTVGFKCVNCMFDYNFCYLEIFNNYGEHITISDVVLVMMFWN